MNLQELLVLASMPEVLVQGMGEPDITNIAEDSRRVEPGCLFVAVRGRSHDGHAFIPQALERGAVAVAGERMELPDGLPADVPYVHVPDDRQAVALFSAAFFDFPSRKLQVIGVTGTDGKTTTSTLIHSILKAEGRKAGLISTIQAEIGARSYDRGCTVTTRAASVAER